MEGQNVWKRTEDIEIDLLDLLRNILMQWKFVAVCAVVFSILMGGYGWMKNRSAAGEAVLPGQDLTVELEPEEQESVDNAVILESEIRGMEKYLEGSVLMKIDPYHKERVILLYSIENAKRQDLQKILESYLSFITNGGAVDALKKSGGKWNMDETFLGELFSASQRTFSAPYQIVVDGMSEGDMMSDAFFSIEITGKDAAAAKQLASDMQSILKKRIKSVKASAGEHKLTLVSSESSTAADTGLAGWQHDKRASLQGNVANLKAMTDAFTDGQKAAYEKETGLIGKDKKDKENGEDKEAEGSAGSGISVKYIALGFIGGIFVYCFLYACFYMLRDTVKSTGEMKALYMFPFYGGISLGKKKGGKQAGDPAREAAKVLNRVRLACKNQEITQLCMAAGFSFTNEEKECLEGMIRQLDGWGIRVSMVENADSDTAVWDSMTEAGNILLVCRIGTTTHRMIDDEMSFYMENGIAVAGAMAFT